MGYNGANVYIRTRLDIPANTIDGGGWKLVRHVPAGDKWHPARDQLRGTEKYGKPCGSTCDKAWSIPFDNDKFNQFLFATGDENKWLIAEKGAVSGDWYADTARMVVKSSLSSANHTVKWDRRLGVPQDPCISLTDHYVAVRAGDILYSGNELSGLHARAVLPKHNGANVFIR